MPFARAPKMHGADEMGHESHHRSGVIGQKTPHQRVHHQRSCRPIEIRVELENAARDQRRTTVCSDKDSEIASAFAEAETVYRQSLAARSLASIMQEAAINAAPEHLAKMAAWAAQKA